MKHILATTAIALVMANGAFAESHVAADGTTTDGTMTTDAPTTDGTIAPASDGMAAPDAAADDTMTTDSATTDNATTGDTTITESTTMDMGMDTAPTMTMDGYSTLMNADVTAEELTGTKVYGPDEDEVGEIGDLVIADDGTVSDVIVDVGGFLGLGEKAVSIAFDSVQLLKETDGDDMRAYVGMTEDQLKELPKYEPMADAGTDMPTSDAPATEEVPAN